MRILLTRPEADAKRSAERLRALGHEPVIAPLFEIVPAGEPWPPGEYDRLLATSAHAFEHLPETADGLKRLPLHVVGERTAAAARATGFAQIESIEPDAKRLAIALARALPAAQRILYLAGRERRPEIEAALAALGHSVTPWVIYRTHESPDAADALARVLRTGGVDAVMHFSPRSAALYMALAERAGLCAEALAPTQIAISARAAENLQTAQDLRVAPAPDLDGMIACL